VAGDSDVPGLSARDRVRGCLRELAVNARDPNLRAAQSSFLLAWMAEWAFTVGIGIVAYRDAGAFGVGLVGLLRMLPAAVLAPFAAPLTDRWRRERVLVVIAAVRAVAFLATAALVASGDTVPVYVLAVLATTVGTLYRPAHSALLPSLCRTAQGLAGANITRGLLDSVAVLVGPLVATVLLSTGSLAAVFVAAGIASAAAVPTMLLVRYEAPPRRVVPQRPSALADVREGLGAVRGERRLGLLFALAAVQTATRGALSVFVVVVAIDLLGTGESGAGLLTTAVGAGAVVGSLGAVLLLGSSRLGAWFGVGVALWGVPLALVAVWPSPVATLALMACLGVGNALVDVGLFTLPARLAVDEVLGRVFVVLEGIIALSVGLGSLVTPLVIDAAGVRGALAVIGCVAPLAVVAAWRGLRALDRAMADRDVSVALLARSPMLHPLPMPAIEHLARCVEPEVVPDRGTVVVQGELGDTFSVIERGEADVLQDGVLIRRLREGGSFGEVALLRDVRRTATVVARGELRLRTLGRAQFVAAVTGYTRSRAEADLLIASLRFSAEEGADAVDVDRPGVAAGGPAGE